MCPPYPADVLPELERLLQERRLAARFQPVITLEDGGLLGFEGLIRGPSDSSLHAPLVLFDAARRLGRLSELEYLCRETVIAAFAAQGGQGKLLLNVDPGAMVVQPGDQSRTLAWIEQAGLSPREVVIELTEATPGLDYAQLRHAVAHYRSLGFAIAIDDLGEGFSSLRLWSELEPDFVKIDKHFVQGAHADPIKWQFLESIARIARNSPTRVIAEGIETPAELAVVRECGIPLGQGYLFGRPEPRPEYRPEPAHFRAEPEPELTMSSSTEASVASLVHYVAPVAPETTNEQVFSRFERDPDLYAIPVVADGEPLGLIARNHFMDAYARPYRRELYGHRPCTMYLDRNALVIDRRMSLQQLSDLITQLDAKHLVQGFIITDAGRYLGLGNGHALLREITRLQLEAARHANPLTNLPGNVPIQREIDTRLKRGEPFVAAYLDLDHFKPYNDIYGFRRGDDILRLVGELLREHTDPARDFVGHIGGDDFIVLWGSPDWQERTEALLRTFDARIPEFYHPEDRARGGIEAEDRQGRTVFFPLCALSVGAVVIDEPQRYESHHAVAEAASVAKKMAKMAKKATGSSLFVERRRGSVASQDAVGTMEHIGELDLGR
ncbi:EAL domain-containing protein [Tepidiphilus sp. B18-69]|uniref:EAL domain-containing protein n=2 Tax=Tepidiphilus baoligensis TaxID=2698687 RepID=A0ABX1QKQ3_9PROT|nr:EAL domain-containing protein [Tepidiphilus baoligensis]